MDEVFFASVLKKWAESSQLVIDLKKRLDEVEKERDEYQNQVANLKGKTVTIEEKSEPTPVSRECRHGHEENVIRLKEAGDRLDKARSEYQKLRDQLHTANARLTSLEQEIENLRQERAQFQSQLQDLQTENTECRSQILTLQNENQKLSKEAVDLASKLQKSEHEKTELMQRTGSTQELTPVGQLQQHMTDLESQIHELQSSARNLETENSMLREELTITREALHKSKESNKNLLTTISKLSHIARNVASAHEPALASQSRHGTPTPANLDSAIKAELASPKSLKSHSSGAPSTIKLAKKDKEEHTDLYNDVTLVEDPRTQPDGLLTSVPSRRLATLASLPVVFPGDDIKDEDNKFTRGFISSAIGGNIQSLIVRVTASGTALAKGRGIEEYLCPRLDHNPWCPSSPGQHGLMFVGLGKEKHTYSTPQLRNLFVGLVKNSPKENRYFRYMGVYEVSRVDPLTIDEWKTLHPSVKMNYIQATKDKNKDPRSKDEIAAAYDSGELSVPCVKLQCVDFDRELYVGLLQHRAARTATTQGRAAKRTRGDEHETDMNIQKCRRIMDQAGPSNDRF